VDGLADASHKGGHPCLGGSMSADANVKQKLAGDFRMRLDEADERPSSIALRRSSASTFLRALVSGFIAHRIPAWVGPNPAFTLKILVAGQ
jgi:hypothetical protein